MRGVRTHLTKKDGEVVPVVVNLNYIYREGKPIGTLGIIRDQRERAKIERHLSSARMQVVQSDKLAMLGRMAAGVAHELNNPLTGITIYGELVRDQLPTDHPVQPDLATDHRGRRALPGYCARPIGLQPPGQHPT